MRAMLPPQHWRPLQGWAAWVNELGEVHVVPEGEKHACSAGCWCGPRLDVEGGSEMIIWVHHSLDGRERYE